ncbi:FtsQ-type POTRA domain-containing protein [Candidatus Puniceispirillum sp.]|nr:FtsQ-type POTRA domain-containing protein [Candidatus Puniceispirillum sp.]
MRRLIDWIHFGKPSRKTLLQKIKICSISFFCVSALSTIGMAMMDHKKLHHDLLKLTANAGLELKKTLVHGRSHTPKETLANAANLIIGTPILGIDLYKLHANISKIGWVEDAIVERRLPNTIRITLRERIPIALLQNNDKHKLIDRKGEIINGADPSKFTHLTVITGMDAAPHAANILSILKTEPELFSEVWAASYRSKRRWDVHLKNGMEIRLPETDPISAWSRLAMIDREKNITDRDLAVIDLRVPRQLVVEPNIPVRGKGSRT